MTTQTNPKLECMISHCNCSELIDPSYRQDYTAKLLNEWIEQHMRETGHNNYRIWGNCSFRLNETGRVPVVEALVVV